MQQTDKTINDQTQYFFDFRIPYYKPCKCIKGRLQCWKYIYINFWLLKSLYVIKYEF